MNETKQADDISLIRNIKSGYKVDESLGELINRHTGICFEVSKNYLNSSSISNIAKDEILNRSDFVIYESVKSFSEEKKVKFSTWVGHNMRYYCLHQINAEKKHHWKRIDQFNHSCVSDNLDQDKDRVFDFLNDHYIDPSPTPFELNCQKEEKIIENSFLQEQLEKADPITKKIIKMRFFSNSKFPIAYRTIAKHVGLSYQGVKLREKRFFELTKKKSKVLLNNNKN